MLQYAAEKEKEAMPRHTAEEEESVPWCAAKEEAMPRHTIEEEAMPRHIAKEVILPYIAEEARPLLRQSAREIICVRSNQLN